MEQVELEIGTSGIRGNKMELVRFQGEELAAINHGKPGDNIYSSLTLYKCPNGYRIVFDFNFGSPDCPARITELIPNGFDARRGLLTKRELESYCPVLLKQAGIARDLDNEIQTSPEKRERVANFARIMRLVHSTTS